MPIVVVETGDEILQWSDDVDEYDNEDDESLSGRVS